MSKLATFNIDETLWEEFKQWAKGKSSNASSELISYIKTCLGYIDNNIDKNLDEAIDRVIKEKVFSYLDLYLDEHLDKRKDVHIEKHLEQNIDTQQKPLPKLERVNETHKDRLTMEDTEQELMDIKESMNQSGVKRSNKDIAARLNIKGFPSPIEGKKWTAGMVSSWLTRGRV